MSRKDNLDYVKHLVSSKLPELLPTPVQPLSEVDRMYVDPEFFGSPLLIGGEPGEVVAGIVDDSLHIYLFAMTWTHPHLAVISPKDFRTIALASLPADLDDLDDVLKEAISAAVRAHRRRFRTCSYCRKSVPPEGLADRTTCHGCAEQHLRIVY